MFHRNSDRVVFLGVAAGLMAALGSGCEGEGPQAELPEVAIVNAGASAAPVAFAAEVGHDELVAVELGLLANGTINQAKTPQASLTPLTFQVALAVTEAGQRAVRAEARVVKMAVGDPPQQASELSSVGHAALRKAIDTMPELKGELVLTPHGFVTKIELKADKGLSNQQRQLIELVKSTLVQLSVPRPDEAGVGTRWTATVAMNRNGFPVTQSQEMAFETGGVVRLHLSESLADDVDKVSPPGVYADDIAVVELEGSGTGELKLRRGALFPTSAQIELEAKSVLTVEQAGDVDDIRSNARLVIKAVSTPGS